MEGNISVYKNLVVWQKAVELVVEIYKLTSKFPPDERFGIISQMKRAAVSIPSNIAEGRRRFSKPEFCHFLKIAFGSGAELETQIEISKQLNLAKNFEFQKTDILLTEVMKMLNSLIAKLDMEIRVKQ